VRDADDTLSAGEGAGPLSDVSRPVGEDSRPMHDGARTIGESSGGPLGGGPVRDPGTRSMLSGPVSASSQGPMREPRLQRSGGSVAESSAGAVTASGATDVAPVDIDAPLGDNTIAPQAVLQDEVGSGGNRDAATEPVMPPPADAPPDPDVAQQ
jgi:hypothetical protein